MVLCLFPLALQTFVKFRTFKMRHMSLFSDKFAFSPLHRCAMSMSSIVVLAACIGAFSKRRTRGAGTKRRLQLDADADFEHIIHHSTQKFMINSNSAVAYLPSWQFTRQVKNKKKIPISLQFPTILNSLKADLDSPGPWPSFRKNRKKFCVYKI